MTVIKEVSWQLPWAGKIVLEPEREMLVPRLRQTAIRRITFSGTPYGVFFDGDYVWVGIYNRIFKFSPGTYSHIGTIGGIGGFDFANDGNYIWTRASGRTIKVIDRHTNTIHSELDIGSSLRGIAFDGSYIWVCDWAESKIFIIDIIDTSNVDQIQLNVRPYQILFDGIYMWVTCPADKSIIIINHYLRLVEAEIMMSNEPRRLAYDGVHVWVANPYSNNVNLINSRTFEVVDTISVGYWPINMEFDGRYMWVANAEDRTVARILKSPYYPEAIAYQSIGVLGFPIGIAFDGTHMWVITTKFPLCVINIIPALPIGFSEIWPL